MTPIKIKTEYSLLKSLITIPKLMSFLHAHNINTCGICDDELFGVMEFYEACHKNNIKPIIGLAITIEDHKIGIYPKNYRGYQKLLRINTLKFTNENTYQNIEDNNLLLVVDADIYDKFNLKNNVYISYKNNAEKVNALLLTSSIIYAKEIRVLSQNDIKYLEYLKLIGSDFEYDDDCYYSDSIDEDDQKRLDNFTKQINLEIPFDKRYIPIYKKGVDSFEYLEKLATLGLNKRFNNIVPKEYLDRLYEELSVINLNTFP